MSPKVKRCFEDNALAIIQSSFWNIFEYMIEQQDSNNLYY